MTSSLLLSATTFIYGLSGFLYIFAWVFRRATAGRLGTRVAFIGLAANTAGIAMIAEAKFPGKLKVFGLQGGGIAVDRIVIGCGSTELLRQNLERLAIGTVVPSSAAMADPTRPETMRPERTGPSSRVMERATTVPTKASALKRLKPV